MMDQVKTSPQMKCRLRKFVFGVRRLGSSCTCLKKNVSTAMYSVSTMRLYDTLLFDSRSCGSSAIEIRFLLLECKEKGEMLLFFLYVPCVISFSEVFSFYLVVSSQLSASSSAKAVAEGIMPSFTRFES